MSTQPIPHYLTLNAKQILVKRPSSMTIEELETWQRHVPVIPLVSLDYPSKKGLFRASGVIEKAVAEAWEAAAEGKGGDLAFDSIFKNYKAIKKEIEEEFEELEQAESDAFGQLETLYEAYANFLEKTREEEERLLALIKKQKKEHKVVANKLIKFEFPACRDFLFSKKDILKHANILFQNESKYQDWLENIGEAFDRHLDCQRIEDGKALSFDEYKELLEGALCSSTQGDFGELFKI